MLYSLALKPSNRFDIASLNSNSTFSYNLPKTRLRAGGTYAEGIKYIFCPLPQGNRAPEHNASLRTLRDLFMKKNKKIFFRDT